MFTVIIGTRAQLIKMAPVMVELESRNLPYVLVFTGQHKATMEELLLEFGVETRPEYVYRGAEVSGLLKMASWFPKVLLRLLIRRRKLFPGKKRTGAVLVHGDTFSTLLGAVAGKLLGRRVMHVESGLRSFDWRNPFPEELTRLAVFRLSDVGFCPGEWATNNLARYRLQAVDTQANTLLDALGIALQAGQSQAQTYPEPYAVVSIHRFENIFSASRLRTILDLLDIMAQHMHMVFVMHPATYNRLQAAGLYSRLEQHGAYSLVSRMTYMPFVNLLAGARCVVTDGGSNQEELSYLGTPTLIMRNATERPEGLDKIATLSEYSTERVKSFLHGLQENVGVHTLLNDPISPSRRIVTFLHMEQ